MKKILLTIALIALVVGIAGYTGRDALLTRMSNQRIDVAIHRADQSLLSDGKLHVILCGTAAALPDPDRAGPCTAIIAGGQFMLIDVGPAAWRNVDVLNLPISKLSAILVTHFHSDHIGEIGEAITQSWIAGRREPLDVYGPPGIESVIAGFRQVYAHDVGYRVAHHSEAYMPARGGSAVAHAFAMPNGVDAVTVFDKDGVHVSAFRVEHSPAEPAVGYRIEYAGRVVVVSGDTRKAASVVQNARGADLLVHEALSAAMTERASARAAETGNARFAKLAHDVSGYHTTPVQAAEVASEAQVGELVLTHIFPPLPNAIARRIFMAGTADAYKGRIVLGEDGMRFDLDPKTAH